MNTDLLRDSDVLEEDYARQRMWNLGLSGCQFFGSVLSQARVGALILVAAAGLEADIKWEQAVVIKQTLPPNRKIAFRSDPHFREIVDDVWIHIMADAKSQNRLSAVDHKPRGSVITTEFCSDVVEILHEKGGYESHSQHSIRN